MSAGLACRSRQALGFQGSTALDGAYAMAPNAYQIALG